MEMMRMTELQETSEKDVKFLAGQMKNFVDHPVALVGGSGKGNAGSSPRISRRIEKDSAPSVLLPLSPGDGIRKAPPSDG